MKLAVISLPYLPLPHVLSSCDCIRLIHLTSEKDLCMFVLFTQPSHAPLRQRKLGNVRPISDSDLQVHIEEEEPSVPPNSRLHQRRRTVPPSVLQGDLSAFQQQRGKLSSILWDTTCVLW